MSILRNLDGIVVSRGDSLTYLCNNEEEETT